MKKETGLAIFLGVAFGIILSLVMIMKTKDKRLETTKPLTKEKKAQKAVADTAGEVQSFKISEPQDRIIVDKDSISVKGTADKDSLLVIQSPIKDIAYKLSSQDFNVSVPLAMGENVIHMVAYSKDGQTKQQKELRVYYLDEQ